MEPFLKVFFNFCPRFAKVPDDTPIAAPQVKEESGSESGSSSGSSSETDDSEDERARKLVVLQEQVRNSWRFGYLSMELLNENQNFPKFRSNLKCSFS